MSRDKSVDLTGVFDIIPSAYDKFLASDFTSLIYCFLDP